MARFISIFSVISSCLYSVPEPPLLPHRCSSAKKSRVPAGKNRTRKPLAVDRHDNHFPPWGLTSKPKQTRNLICDVIRIRHTKKTRNQICDLCCSSDCSFFLLSPTVFYACPLQFFILFLSILSWSLSISTRSSAFF
jgi:hypothetical protein